VIRKKPTLDSILGGNRLSENPSPRLGTTQRRAFAPGRDLGEISAVDFVNRWDSLVPRRKSAMTDWRLRPATAAGKAQRV
jgi:hypothetical protein